MPAIDKHPAAIARPADATEVAIVVALAREHGIELAVRGGGHSLAGHGVSERGLVLDLAQLNDLQIDPHTAHRVGSDRPDGAAGRPRPPPRRVSRSASGTPAPSASVD